MSSSSSTVTMATTAYDHAFSPANSMIASYSSATGSPAPRSAASHVAKVYRQASSLFLTRRLPEALTTILTIIAPPSGFGAVNGDYHEAPPVASATRNSRIKTWSLYLTLVDSIVNLPPEEGKAAFGTQEWRELVAKVRDGKIWGEVVKFGYADQEGEVDPEIVINLSTLLLSHSPSQAFNQQQLENYLSACANPTLDFSSVIDSHGSLAGNRDQQRRRSQNGGTNTPRDLNARIKILELYTLHVLPRNNEWDYAKEFIRISEILDDERREAFLQTLQSLQDEKKNEAKAEREREAQLQREKQEAQARKAEEQARAARQAITPEETTNNGAVLKKRGTHETDYGIDGSRPRSSSRASKPSRPPPSTPSRTNRPGPKKIIKQATHILSSLQNLVSSLTSSTLNNRASLIRLLLLIAALAATFGNQDIRERVNRVFGKVWEKLKSTVGMGVKVSYI